MAIADRIFRSMCRDILDSGEDTKDELVRPTWTDTGEKAYTIKKFGVVNRYDLRKEFPALTLRKTYLKSAFDELLWIWQKKSNNINDLNSSIWDSWADKNGSIGKAYGYQIGKSYVHHKLDTPMNMDEEAELRKEYPSAKVVFDDNDNSYIKMDQIDSVLWDLRHNPYSRRIITNIYNLNDLYEMNLYPCAYSMTFNVTKNKDTGKYILNGILNQRSQDVLTANNWNVCQYALLIMMIAQCTNTEPGELVHVIADCHIYDRHVDIIKELIYREAYPAPKVWLNPEKTNFYDFTVDDLFVENYQTGEQVKNIPIAV